MSETSTTARTLRLLELLQARRYWPGPVLAARLGVTERTLRRDVGRLRDLGYRVSARRGRDGGYEMAPGGQLPPLVFTPGEATVIASAVATAINGLADAQTGLSALAKVEQVMPSAARRRVQALRSTVALGAGPGTPTVDPEILAMIALACRDGERLRLLYTSATDEHGGSQDAGSGSGESAGSPTSPPAGASRTRLVDPVRLVPRGALWYLLCWDVGRRDWRTLRVDRISTAEPTGVRSHPPQVPGGDASAYVEERLAERTRQTSATILIHAPLAEVEGYMGSYASGFSAATGKAGEPVTLWRIADVRPEVLAAALIWLVWPFEVLDSPGLVELLSDLATRFAAASGR